MSVPPMLTWPTPSPSSQSPLLSMPTQSNSTPAVSSTTGAVVPNLTTVSSLSDMDLKTVKTSGSSKTPGAPPGVNPVTSDLLEEATELVCAVSPCSHLTLPHN